MRCHSRGRGNPFTHSGQLGAPLARNPESRQFITQRHLSHVVIPVLKHAPIVHRAVQHKLRLESILYSYILFLDA